MCKSWAYFFEGIRQCDYYYRQERKNIKPIIVPDVLQDIGDKEYDGFITRPYSELPNLHIPTGKISKNKTFIYCDVEIVKEEIIMSEINESKLTYVLWSAVLGKVSFLISGVAAGIVIQFLDNYILATIIAGGVGGLLLGLFLRLRHKVGRMAIAGMIGMPVALLLTFLFAGVFGSLFPSTSTGIENSFIPDISSIVLMGIIFGAVVGSMTYGRKSIWLFAIVSGIVSIPSGIFVAVMNSGSDLKVRLDNLLEVFGEIDLNFLAMTISLGIGLGLSIGLYHRLKPKKS